MNTLAVLLSSRVRAEIFRILFGINQSEYHLRDIQRRSGLAIGTVRQEAKKLEKLGLIIKQQDGNRTYYRANENHSLYITLHTLVLKTSGLTEILQKALSIESIKFAFVFGSIASGKENANSDIDLFILGDIGLRSVSKLLKEPGQTIGREINPHIMTIDEFVNRNREKEHFVSSIVKSPKLMIIGTDHDLEGLGK